MGTIYKLIIEDDEGKTTVYPLSQGEISIGRKEGNTIRLMERNVSRRHARLLRANGSVFIEDLDSYNGIRINGERINGRYEVKEGDLVEIGDYHLALQAAEIEDDLRNRDRESQSERPDPNARRDGEWPTAGTVPDFRLPEEILAGVRASMQQNPPRPGGAAPRDTLVDQPAPMAAPTPAVMQPKAAPPPFSGAPLETAPLHGQSREPLIGPPPRGNDDGQQRPLPAFPLPGGLPAPQVPLFPQGHAPSHGQPPALKPQQAPPKDLAATTPINVGPARTATVPRLVCVSTNYAGKEFALTRPELIIGRVEDNDIVIEHRSVSRNHAKIVFDGRAHKIIDLQSANGILVNGEEYAMTDLRKGDLIELGHVRFRFVPAGEAFLPNDDEIREMKDAGVTPPSNDTAAMLARSLEATQQHLGPTAPPTPAAQSGKLTAPPKPDHHPEVPAHFDPSTAATVTDTPLSALSMGPAMTPQIDAPPPLAPSAGPPPRKSESAHEKSERATVRADRSDTAAPRSAGSGGGAPASHDQRPTEINIAARQPQNGSALGASATPKHPAIETNRRTPPGAAAVEVGNEPAPPTRPNTQNLVEVEGRLEPPRAGAKVGILIGIVLLLIALGAVAYHFLTAVDNSADRAVMENYRAGNVKAVLEQCRVNKDKLHDAAALKICLEVQMQQFKQEEKPPPSTNNLEPDKKPEQAVEADPPAGDEDEPPSGDHAEETASDAMKKAHAKQRLAERVDRTPPAKGLPDKGAKTVATPEKIMRAKELHDRAWRSWTNGDANKAIDLLNQCVSLANLPKCHRTLGSVYAQINDTAKSLEHYKKYLILDPNASDAQRVKDIIKGAESDQ